ncbi:MAG: hypothetical protein UDG86_08410 [Lachnospiraceae bacterium]|nr:hypothetical protein [Lachnospiraceae bacterium]
MAAANIKITSVTITPNPVQTGKQYTISVEIKDIPIVLGDDSGVLTDADGKLIDASSS